MAIPLGHDSAQFGAIRMRPHGVRRQGREQEFLPAIEHQGAVVELHREEVARSCGRGEGGEVVADLARPRTEMIAASPSLRYGAPLTVRLLRGPELPGGRREDARIFGGREVPFHRRSP